ncbi:hypothetical protein [Gaoshiqia sediminis]|uniref:Uncharacterized protein n=1 Tax=Gaoshiqia sediminis TaxID=2986998 RepID=A0AA41YAB5_9BACT|nr:hypothetical protein [Gaoshiqia sediminis]MCW0484586.1 hypothetical protein [Gaoshiqia sediminis]
MGTGSKGSVIASILDDLTHLQIDTIIKSGMIAADPPEKVEELLTGVLGEYVRKLGVISRRNELDRFPRALSAKSFLELEELLIELQNFMDRNRIRMAEPDYILYSRMVYFCRYIKSKDEEFAVKGQPNVKLSAFNLVDSPDFELEGVSVRDKAKLRRYHDLGTEKVVLQTRIGLDGDVVARIEEGFANSPKQMLLDIHEKHTKLSVDFWSNLVNTVVTFVGKLFDFKS